MRAVLLGLVVAVAVAASAAPAAAQTGTVAGTVNSTSVPSGGTAPTFSGATSNTAAQPDTTVVTIHSSRTILNMGSFQLQPEDTLNIVVAAASHRVLVRVPTSASVNGKLIVTIGAPSSPANTGGNVWISAAGGAFFGSNASVAAGGLLATTASTGDTDFFADAGNFSGGQNGITLANGAVLQGNGGGAFVFAGPTVQQGSHTVGGDAEVLLGGATSFSLDLMASGEVEHFLPTEASPHFSPIDHFGTTTANDVLVSSLSSAAGASVTADGMTANGAVASGDGNVVISTGGGIESANGQLMPKHAVGAAPHKLVLGTVTAGSLRAAATGDLQLAAGETFAAQHAGLSTGADFSNGRGATAMNGVGKWLVRVPAPAGHNYNGLNSQNRALWGAGLDKLAPDAANGNRYAFGFVPQLTFRSLDATKIAGHDGSHLLDYSVTGLHPGVNGAFAADDEAAAFSGQPELHSEGVPAEALRDTYPVDISKGTLTGAYSFAFDSAGEFTVVRRPEPVAYDDFSSADGLTLSGSAAVAKQRVQLTTDRNDDAGGAFTSGVAVVPSAPFSTSFQFQASGDPDEHGDGIAFVLQTDPRGAAALGTHGGMLGYGYGGGTLPAAISPSLAVEFDTHDNTADGVDDPDANHVGIALNGHPENTVVTATPEFEMFGAEAVYAWVDYDPFAGELSVFVAEEPAKPEKPLLTHTVNLQAVLGGAARAGFTAATGEYAAIHEVIAWRLSQLTASATSVSCSPSPVDVGAETSCTATVADTAPAGKSTPTGAVSFGGAAAGKSCELAPTGTTGTAACAVGVTLSSAGGATVSAQFGGDAAHEASDGSTQLSASVRDVSVSVSCADQSPQAPRPDATPCEVRVAENGSAPITPTGPVTLALTPGGETKQCELAAVAGDASAASCTARLAGGSDGEQMKVTATYGGDQQHGGGEATRTFERVTRAGTTAAVSCAAPPTGAAATSCTVVVSDVRGAPAPGTDAGRLPSGKVAVGLGGETGECALAAHAGSSWQASCAVPATAGAEPIAVDAAYSGSAVHRPSAAAGEIPGVLDQLPAGLPGTLQVGPSTVDFGKSRTVTVGGAAVNSGRVPVGRADCDPGAATSTCVIQLTGTIEFRDAASKRAVAEAAARRRRYRLARSRVSVKVGQVKRLAVRLPAKARKRLRRARRATMKVTIVASSDGGLKRRITRTIKLRMR